MMTKKRAILLIGSAKRPGGSTSEALGKHLLQEIEQLGWSTEVYHVAHVARTEQRIMAFLPALAAADLLVLSSPVYVDAPPYLVTLLMERIAAADQSGRVCPLRLAAISNCGFPEIEHNRTALAIYEQFARTAGLDWVGGLAMGMGGVIDGQSLSQVDGRGQRARMALEMTATALVEGNDVPREAVEIMAQPVVSARVYTLMGEVGWRLQARKRDVLGKLRDRPYAPSSR
jgi:hypothetical protein